MTAHSLRLILAAVFGVLTTASPSRAGVEVGRPVPALVVEELLQATPGASKDLASLKGKPIVLEFWATWCGPCVSAIPHMNRLAEKFSPKGVVFISITDEGREKVEKFLKRKEMRSWIGLDTDKSIFKCFDVGGIPHTVLIDAKGNVAAVTYPTDVDESVLENLIAGKPIDMGAGSAIVEQGKHEAPMALAEFSISPCVDASGGSTFGLFYLRFDCALLKTIIASAMRSRPSLVVMGDVPNERYTAVARVAKGRGASLCPLLARTIEAALSVVIREEDREIDVYVATLPKRGEQLHPTAMEDGGSHSSSNDNHITGSNLSIPTILGNAEQFLDKPVIDETGDEGRYDFEAAWDAGKPEDVLKALRGQLGFELKPATRRVKVVVVEPAE